MIGSIANISFLVAAMGFVCVAAVYALGKKFTIGDLRVKRSGQVNKNSNADDHHH